jgi:hypothetical protein
MTIYIDSSPSGQEISCLLWSPIVHQRVHKGQPLNPVLITLMMEAVSPPETSVIIYQTTQCSIPEDTHFQLILGCSWRELFCIWAVSWEKLSFRLELFVCSENLTRRKMGFARTLTFIARCISTCSEVPEISGFLRAAKMASYKVYFISPLPRSCILVFMPVDTLWQNPSTCASPDTTILQLTDTHMMALKMYFILFFLFTFWLQGPTMQTSPT